jgi:hypothetical protein
MAARPAATVVVPKLTERCGAGFIGVVVVSVERLQQLLGRGVAGERSSCRHAACQPTEVVMRPNISLILAVAGLVLLPALSVTGADDLPSEVHQVRQPRLVMFETFQRPG